MRERKREMALIRREMLPFQPVRALMGRELRVSEKEMPLFENQRRGARRGMPRI